MFTRKSRESNLSLADNIFYRVAIQISFLDTYKLINNYFK